MKPLRRAALCIFTALAAVASPAAALAAGPAPLPRPVVGQLSLAKTPVSAGKLPALTVRIDETGVHMVYVQLTLTNLASHTVALLVTSGWVSTWHSFTVAWPAHAALAPGSYQLSVSAHDRREQPLMRGPHTSGLATLTVTGPPHSSTAPAAVTPAPAVAAPSAVSTSAPEAGVPPVAQTVAEGALFPVAGAHNFGGPENLFGAPRDGYSHQGQDILTAEGTPIVAPLSGTILTASYQEGGAGYYAVEHTAIGFDFMFAHCQAGTVAVSTGQGVSAGQTLCHAGQTGDATTPHVDFEMWVGGWQSPGSHPINPLPYLEAWESAAAAG